MPRSITLSGCLSLLLLTAACGSSATFYDPTAEIKQAAEGAFTDLAEQPALLVEGSLSAFGGSAADFHATVLNDGTAWAEFTGDGKEGQILTLPGSTHVRADSEFWKSKFEPDMHDILDDEWVLADSDEWFSPGGVFNPATFGQSAYEHLLARDAFQVATPETAVIDGVDAFSVSYGGGTVNVSAQAPHRLISMDEVLLSVPDAVSGNETVGTFTVTIAQKPDIEAVSETVGAALTDMDEVYNRVYPDDVDSEMTESRLNCDGAFCTLYLTIEVTFSGESGIEKLLFVQSGTVDGGSHGVETCTSSKTGAPGEKVSLSCVTDFSHANGNYEVEGENLVQWIGIYTFDAAAAIEALDATVEELLAE